MCITRVSGFSSLSPALSLSAVPQPRCFTISLYLCSILFVFFFSSLLSAILLLLHCTNCCVLCELCASLVSLGTSFRAYRKFFFFFTNFNTQISHPLTTPLSHSFSLFYLYLTSFKYLRLINNCGTRVCGRGYSSTRGYGDRGTSYKTTRFRASSN